MMVLFGVGILGFGYRKFRPLRRVDVVKLGPVNKMKNIISHTHAHAHTNTLVNCLTCLLLSNQINPTNPQQCQATN